MKKLIMAAAIVCAAAALNASTVSWGITSGSIDSTKFADGTLYLVHGSAAPSLKDLSVSKFTIDNILAFTGDSMAVLNTVSSTLDLVNGAGKIVGTSGNVTSYGDDKLGTGAYTVYSVAISDDGKYAAVSTLKTLNINATSTAPAQANWAGANFTPYTAAVPEPTSGLLLLLGVAGMALRRRRA